MKSSAHHNLFRPNGTPIVSYDDRGRGTNVTSYDSTSGGTVLNEVKYTYADSNWGQITEIQQNDTGAVGGGTPAIDYTYDDGAVSGAAKYLRRTSVTYPGPSTRRVVYYNYPSSGDGSVLSRLDNIADSSAGTTKYAQYTYLGSSAISALAHPAVTYGLDLKYDPSANGTFTNLDQFGQITTQSWLVSGSGADTYTYGYDYNGNRTYRAYGGYSMDQLYTYDTLDRLTDMQRGTLNSGKTAMTGTVAEEEQFTLDELGNWPEYLTKASGTTNLDQTRAHTTANETGTITHVTGTTWVSPSYDLAGNMVQGPKPGSEATNLKFIYDGWNRMVQVQDNSSTIIATYRFDGQNHRIRKLLGSNPSSPTSYYDYYYNENWQVLEERLGGSTNPYAHYIWDPRHIDAPVVRFRDADTDGTIDDTVYYCTDANMNVTALTDGDGLVVERYRYDTYGQVHFYHSNFGSTASSSSYGNEILFGGYRYDPETGLYHVRNRTYHPTVGRWGQRDPAGYAADSVVNLYQYAHASAGSFIDPSGLDAVATTQIGPKPGPTWNVSFDDSFSIYTSDRFSVHSFFDFSGQAVWDKNVLRFDGDPKFTGNYTQGPHRALPQGVSNFPWIWLHKEFSTVNLSATPQGKKWEEDLQGKTGCKMECQRYYAYVTFSVKAVNLNLIKETLDATLKTATATVPGTSATVGGSDATDLTASLSVQLQKAGAGYVEYVADICADGSISVTRQFSRSMIGKNGGQVYFDGKAPNVKNDIKIPPK